MKKLFTLFALLAMVMGVSAKMETVIDAETNFASKEDGPSDLAAWGGGECLSFQDGLLHFQLDEAKANPWDVQFFPISSASLDADYTYTIEFKIKGTGGEIFNMAFGGLDKYGVYTVPSDGEWHVVKVEYSGLTDPGKNGGGVLFQCGAYVGEWDMEYMKITHEENVSDKPIEWVDQIVNGDANGEYGDVPCVQTKEYGFNLENEDNKSSAQPHSATIEEDVDGNKVFVCHAPEVNPVLLWDADGEQWGTQHKAGDPMPDNAWQNQMWIVFPKAYKAGEQIKLSFRYKASKAVKVDTQSHGLAGAYIGNGPVGQLSFTTSWQTFEKTVSVDDNQQSIAFNLGSEIYDQDIDFFLDDIKAATMKLDEGIFVASTNTNNDLVPYDFDNAIQFEYDAELDAYTATVGTEGDNDSWVNEVMISTVRGNDRNFKANTIKGKFAIEDYTDYVAASGAKIKLPALGVWTIVVDPIQQQFTVMQVEGDAPKKPIDVVANPTKVIVNAVEREYTSTEEVPEGYEFKTKFNEETFEYETVYGNPWDNQFIIMGNRALEAGEETYIEFKYKAAKPATVGTQCGGGEYAGQYIYWNALGDINFTEEEQTFKIEYTVPADANGMQAFNFNMAVIKDANVYEISDIIWKLADDTETLIDMEGTKNFFVKEGADTAPYEFGTDPSAALTVEAAEKVAKGAIVNLAGQQVTKSYQGIVIINGNKYIQK